ncbi:MAG: cupin domain-containing protein [Bryobacteraceae bacterium]|nr:cupin domain-containing protein [Bryobacteraceae bacterium]
MLIHLLLLLALAEPLAVDPHRIAWQQINPDGTKYSVLEGNRESYGETFSYAFFLPKGVWVKPHRHTQDARVFVAKGKLRIGFGEKLDSAKTIVLEPGGFIYVPSSAAHFETADEDCLIIGVGSGKWATRYLE